MLELIIAVLIITVVAVILWAITEKLPDPTMKTVVRAVVLLILILVFLRQYGSQLGL